MESSEIKPISTLYTGLESYDHRGKTAIEKEWSFYNAREKALLSIKEPDAPEVIYPPEIEKLNIDQHLADLAQHAIKQGRNNLVIVDIGSGQSGSFVFSFTEAETDFPIFAKFLTEHKGFNVRVIGATGARKNQKNGQQLRKEEKPLLNNSSVSMENYAYTITRSHSLDIFLQKIIGGDIPDEQWSIAKRSGCVDAYFSTWALGYFTPKNFEGVIEDISATLFPKGTMHCVVYNDVPPGFEKSREGLFSSLRIRNKDHFLYKAKWGATDLEPAGRHDVLKKLVRFLLKNNYCTVLELQKQMRDNVYSHEEIPSSQQFVEQFKKMPFLNEQNISKDEFLKKIEDLSENTFDDRMRTFDVFANLFDLLEERIYFKTWIKTQKKKIQVLEKFKSSKNFRVFYNRFIFFLENQSEV